MIKTDKNGVLRSLACAMALAALGAVSVAAFAPATAYAQAYKPGRLADGKTPDFRGIWQAVETKAGINLEGSPGQKSVIYDPADGKIPYKPDARKLQQANYKDRMSLDPLRKCFQGGVPRTTYSSMPMQFVQGEGGHIAIIYQENHAFRYMYPESRPHYEDIDSWMGDNRYRWDGDVLVTSNKAQAPTWFDEAGNHHTNATHVVEHYAMTDANTIRYEATITDPELYTRPWSIRITLKRNTTPGAALVEDECIPDENGIRRRVDPFKPEALVKNTNRRWTLIPEQK